MNNRLAAAAKAEIPAADIVTRAELATILQHVIALSEQTEAALDLILRNPQGSINTHERPMESVTATSSGPFTPATRQYGAAWNARELSRKRLRDIVTALTDAAA